jgi:hypothetical protein
MQNVINDSVMVCEVTYLFIQYSRFWMVRGSIVRFEE